MKDDNSTNGGVSFLGLLTLLLIGLKLTGYIDWSWLLVLAPVLIPIVLLVAIVIYTVARVK